MKMKKVEGANELCEQRSNSGVDGEWWGCDAENKSREARTRTKTTVDIYNTAIINYDFSHAAKLIGTDGKHSQRKQNIIDSCARDVCLAGQHTTRLSFFFISFRFFRAEQAEIYWKTHRAPSNIPQRTCSKALFFLFVPSRNGPMAEHKNSKS